jgi:acyl-coenzyme A synthetase/AMP-(fatty) acid ligase
MPGLISGATVVYAKTFSRSRFDSWLKDYGITICVGVPTVINMLLERQSTLHKRDLPALRFMTSSTAPLLIRNQLEFEQKYGIPINQQAGSSETAWMALNDPADIGTDKRKIGSIGKPPIYKEVFIIDDTGKRLKPGEEGEIIVKGKSLAYGYMWEDGTVGKFPEDGFHTGDLGYMDKDGCIFITGRKKNQVVRGGVKISPAEITNWIMEHPAVQVAETIGVPDKVYGEDVVSFIITKEGEKLTEKEILEHCRKKLPAFKMPKAIFFMKEFPVGTTGKISKQGLLKVWEEKQGKSAEGGVISYKGDK